MTTERGEATRGGLAPTGRAATLAAQGKTTTNRAAPRGVAGRQVPSVPFVGAAAVAGYPPNSAPGVMFGYAAMLFLYSAIKLSAIPNIIDLRHSPVQ